MDVSASFSALIQRIQPTAAGVAAANSHVATIRTRLKLAFDVSKHPIIGSFSRETFIRGKSDVDIFCVLARDEVRHGDQWISSNTILNRIKTEMEARFRSTPVSRDVQAIVIEFTDCSVDVVPAFYWKFESYGYPSYYMPDGAGGWMKTSPEYHNKYIRTADEDSRGKLKRVAQLLKFWRVCRTPHVPLSSFHIEMMLASEGICVGVKSYPDCVTDALRSLARRECRGLQDPLGVSGYINCVKTEVQRDDSLAAVKYSRNHATAALQTRGAGRIDEAKRQWDIVFNGEFPA